MDTGVRIPGLPGRIRGGDAAVCSPSHVRDRTGGIVRDNQPNRRGQVSTARAHDEIDGIVDSNLSGGLAETRHLERRDRLAFTTDVRLTGHVVDQRLETGDIEMSSCVP